MPVEIYKADKSMLRAHCFIGWLFLLGFVTKTPHGKSYMDDPSRSLLQKPLLDYLVVTNEAFFYWPFLLSSPLIGNYFPMFELVDYSPRLCYQDTP